MKQPYEKEEVLESAIDLILKAKRFHIWRSSNSHGDNFKTIAYSDGLTYRLFMWVDGEAIREAVYEADDEQIIDTWEISGRTALALIDKHWDERIGEHRWDLWHAKIMAEVSL